MGLPHLAVAVSSVSDSMCAPVQGQWNGFWGQLGFLQGNGQLCQLCAPTQTAWGGRFLSMIPNDCTLSTLVQCKASLTMVEDWK